MEFACGYIYLPPGRSATLHNVKRSALLPPTHKLRHKSSPPPVPQLIRSQTLAPPSTSTFEPLALPQSIAEQELAYRDPHKRGSDMPSYHNMFPDLHHTQSRSSRDPETPVVVSLRPTELTPMQPVKSPGAMRRALLPPPMRHQIRSSSPTPQPIRTDCSTSNPEVIHFYDLPQVTGSDVLTFEPDYSYIIPEGSGVSLKLPETPANKNSSKSPAIIRPATPPPPPPLPTRPPFMKRVPLYLEILPLSTTASTMLSTAQSTTPVTTAAATVTAALSTQPLPGNPNVILVSVGQLVTEEIAAQCVAGEPASCSQCGSVTEAVYDNVVSSSSCYYCAVWEDISHPTPRPPGPMDCEERLFLLPSDPQAGSLAADPLVVFCVDVSGSMSITTEVIDSGQTVYLSRLQVLQQCLLSSLSFLCDSTPNSRVALITFNNQVTVHGVGEAATRSLQEAELIDIDFLSDVGRSFPTPPPVTKSRERLQREILRFVEGGATALGPAATVAIAMASRQPGSKVLVCTDGLANTALGNLEQQDGETLICASIFYQDLAEQAVRAGVTVSVLGIEGTECRLAELGRLADRTGGMVSSVSESDLESQLQKALQRQTVATHSSALLYLPTALCFQGEKEEGSKTLREVGNVSMETELTCCFRLKGEKEREALLSCGSVSVQLQLRYRVTDGRKLLRVITVERGVTDDSSMVLSSLSLSLLQVHCAQKSAALVVRGRYSQAQKETDEQRQLMERVLEHRRSQEEKETYCRWKKEMSPIYEHNFQAIPDGGATLLYGLKNAHRKSSLP
ncbi:circularly permutated Ras protein 1 isoform X2 [Amia ocellicauda]|uniref:circularly permutated Ras protein 1 isoform X2 n=1 Tax=Amia ocellicauda TaxID=2972642 RepID=UPI003463DF28